MSKVFLDYDQAALDRAYDQPSWAPNMQEVLQRRAATSDAVRARLGAPRRLAYGPTEIERLDLFPTSRPDAPIMIFLHGGAWRGGDARSQAFAAETTSRPTAAPAGPRAAARRRPRSPCCFPTRNPRFATRSSTARC